MILWTNILSLWSNGSIWSPSLYVYKWWLYGHGLAYWRIEWMHNHLLARVPWSPDALGYNIYYGAITFSISRSIVCKIPILFIHLNVKDHNAFGFKHAWRNPKLRVKVGSLVHHSKMTNLVLTSYGAFTLDVKSMLNWNLDGILGGTQCQVDDSLMLSEC
jgi:hypothetical protein